MLSKAELEIISLFRRNIFLKASIRELYKKLGSKSYQRAYEAVKKLQKEEFLNIDKRGHSNFTSLVINEKSISLLSFLEEQEAFRKKIPHTGKLLAIKETSQFLIIITGSYARGKATKKSDIDLVIVIPDKENPVHLQKLVENLALLWHPPVHLYIFKKKDFLEMLLSKGENYGKEIFKNHIVLKNSRIYYEILKEAIEHGFSNKSLY